MKLQKIDEFKRLRVGSQNVDGMSEAKLLDLHMFLESQKLDIFVLSELKKQEGELLTRFDIPGYSLKEFLRSDSQSGGLAAYVREGQSCKIEIGRTPRETDTEWMDSERLWISVSGSKKVAICTTYLRCEQPVNSIYYKNNQLLLNKIKEESSIFRQKGFAVVHQGDFNSHVGDFRPCGIPGMFEINIIYLKMVY